MRSLPPIRWNWFILAALIVGSAAMASNAIREQGDSRSAEIDDQSIRTVTVVRPVIITRIRRVPTAPEDRTTTFARTVVIAARGFASGGGGTTGGTGTSPTKTTPTKTTPTKTTPTTTTPTTTRPTTTTPTTTRPDDHEGSDDGHKKHKKKHRHRGRGHGHDGDRHGDRD